jgi:hypothetical protein
MLKIKSVREKRNVSRETIRNQKRTVNITRIRKTQKSNNRRRRRGMR